MEEESPLGTIYKNKELESIDWTEPDETEKFVWFSKILKNEINHFLPRFRYLMVRFYKWIDLNHPRRVFQLFFSVARELKFSLFKMNRDLQDNFVQENVF